MLCSRIIRTHPLPDGNKRVGYVAALELVVRNDAAWTPPPDDEEGDHTVDVIESSAAGEPSEEAVTSWVHQRGD